ncbi:hypothetical protein YC2023_087184 [Brassica napus]
MMIAYEKKSSFLTYLVMMSDCIEFRATMKKIMETLGLPDDLGFARVLRDCSLFLWEDAYKENVLGSCKKRFGCIKTEAVPAAPLSVDSVENRQQLA